MASEIANLIIGEAPEVARIRVLLAPVAEDMGFEIVRIRFLGGEGRRTLQIMAERPDGTMDIGSCAALSRAFSAVLDVEDPFPNAYDLEVSSPGIDRPLTRLKDFERYQGYEAKLETSTLIDGRRKFHGTLEGVEANEILLRVHLDPKAEPQVLGFEFGIIGSAKLVLSDELIRQDLNEKDAGADAPSDQTEIN